MQILSLTGIVLYVGLSLPALAAWLLGAGAIAALCSKAMGAQAATYDADSGKLIVAGSWVPMLVIVGIFLVRYTLGVATAMQFPAMRDPNVQLAISLLLGAFSGFFLARGLLFWRVQSAVRAA